MEVNCDGGGGRLGVVDRSFGGVVELVIVEVIVVEVVVDLVVLCGSCCGGGGLGGIDCGCGGGVELVMVGVVMLVLHLMGPGPDPQWRRWQIIPKKKRQ